MIEREYRSYGDFQNWAIPQAAQPWVLVLDSDERVTPALAAEIRGLLDGHPPHTGYSIPRRNHFLGHPIRFGPWMHDHCLRLFRRDAVRYVGNTDHAHAKLRSGSVGTLRNHLVHYTCTSYEQYLPKLQHYAATQARVWYQEGAAHQSGPTVVPRTVSLPARVRRPARLFGRRRRLAGLRLVAYLSYLKHARLWELQNAKSRHRREISAIDVNTERLPAGDTATASLSVA